MSRTRCSAPGLADASPGCLSAEQDRASGRGREAGAGPGPDGAGAGAGRGRGGAERAGPSGPGR
ncbi:hypothetical protein, partial [Microlunatus sp. GCM10028923]|uniref:hypothetical protein n=1 Tax=Microlunatus sp. GCM10028923 TaxID=3273400 RepID=UPI00361271D0